MARLVSVRPTVTHQSRNYGFPPVRTMPVQIGPLAADAPVTLPGVANLRMIPTPFHTRKVPPINPIQVHRMKMTVAFITPIP